MSGIDLKKIAVPEKKASAANKESIAAFLNKDIALFGKKQLSDKKKESFYNELALLLDSGVDIKSALELIESEQAKKQDKELFSKIREQVVSGKGLSQAMEESAKFSEYEYYSVQIGEKSGELLKVLGQLRSYYDSRIKQKRQIVSALTYPIIVVCMSAVVVVFMISFVVPAFADMLKRFKSELPPVTKFILSLSDSFAIYFPIFLVVAFGGYLYYRANRHKEWMRRRLSNLFLKVPVLGPLAQRIALARFCQSMALLLGAKVAINDAIVMVKKMINYYPIEASLNEVESDLIEKGSSLSESISKHKIYPRQMIYLIKVAEGGNQMEKIFAQLSRQYSDEVEHRSKILNTLLEPVIMIFLGFVVGFILVALYAPMFSMTDILK